jgi:hypothetical protein
MASRSKHSASTGSAAASGWNSLRRFGTACSDQVASDEVPKWHLAELARRRALADAQPGVGKPWREVLDRLERGTCSGPT